MNHLSKTDTDTDSLVGLLISQIKHDIIFGLLLPNDALDLDTLKSQYGGNDVHLHQALSSLANQQLVYIRNNQFTVLAPTPDDINTLTNARIKLDCKALEHSMQNGNKHWQAMVVSAHKNLLINITKAQQISNYTPAELEESSRNFYRSLIIACDNLTLIKQHDTLYQKRKRFIFDNTKAMDFFVLKSISSDLVSYVLAKDIYHAKRSLERLIRNESASI